MRLPTPSLTLTLRARGDATPEQVWERYADLDLWSSWSPQVRAVDAAERRLRTGLEGRVRGPLGIGVPFVVTDVGDRDWAWDVRLPLVTMHLRHRVLADPRGCATELDVEGPLPLVLGYLAPARLALGRLVRA